jgi:hypothetical protein
LQYDISRLRQSLTKTQGFRKTLELDENVYEQNADESHGDDTADELEVGLLGSVAVDSGQLMITDPCYVDSVWKKEPYTDDRKYIDTLTGTIWEYGKDFTNFEYDVLHNGTSVNKLLASGRFQPRWNSDNGAYHFSYDGACKASSSSTTNEMVFDEGHPGAGVCFHTAFGDGLYPIYAEKHGGRITRVYVNVA